MEYVNENNYKSKTNFTDFLSSFRKFCRQIVLPVKKIKTICMKHLSENDICSVLDFGAGTLFWTDWFLDEFKCTVYAVDPYYEKCENIKKENVVYYYDVNKYFEDHSKISLIWACDVLHHLSNYDYENFFKKSIKRTNIMIIKDIDMYHKFGNFMNRMHDKIINKENINNIDPKYIKNILEGNGFETFLLLYTKDMVFTFYNYRNKKKEVKKKNGT
jgi:hypothetical protein